MKIPLARWLVFVSALLLASCYQEERSYTLNSDGSGKVEFKATFPLDGAMNISFGESEEKGSEEKLQDAVRKILEESEGVAAWSDVSFSLNDEEKVVFEGTAYFKDLNAVELKMGSTTANNLVPVMSRSDNLVTIECSQSSDDDEEEGDDEKEEDGPKWDEMSEAEQKAQIAKATLQLTQMKAMMVGVVGDMTTKVTLHLPKEASAINNIEKRDDGSYFLETSGERMLEGIDALLENEELLRSVAESDPDMNGAPPDEMLEAMFGHGGNPSVSFAADASPSFDFKKEVTAAQKAAPAMLKKLGLEIEQAAPMKGEAAFESLRLAGLRVVTSSGDKEVRPFNWSKGLSLSFIGKLPGAIISVDEGKVSSFVLDNGQNMLSSKKWDREIRSVDLSEDGTLIGFEINTDRLPDAGVSSIQEIKGELICMAASATKTVDLAFKEIAEGEKSEHFGAKIEEVGQHSFHKDKKEISIHFELKRDLIKEVRFVDPDGVVLKSDQNGYSWSNDSGQLTFTCDKSLSDDCRVEVEVFSDLERHTLPFVIENLPLLPFQPAGE